MYNRLVGLNDISIAKMICIAHITRYNMYVMTPVQTLLTTTDTQSVKYYIHYNEVLMSERIIDTRLKNLTATC